MATGPLDPKTLDLLIDNLERNRGPLNPAHRSVIHNINQHEHFSAHP